MESSRPTNWWDAQTEEYLEEFLRTEKEGLQHPSRIATRKLVEHLVAELPPHRVLEMLDVGCGAGVEYENYQQFDPKLEFLDYQGVDSSEKMVKICQERHKPWHCSCFMAMSAEDLHFPDEHFDLVLLRHVLEHLEDGYEKAMDEALRVSRDLVVVIFFEPLSKDPEDHMRICKELGAVEAEVPHSIYSRQRWFEFLLAKGLLATVTHSGDNEIHIVSKTRPLTNLTMLLNKAWGAKI